MHTSTALPTTLLEYYVQLKHFLYEEHKSCLRAYKVSVGVLLSYMKFFPILVSHVPLPYLRDPGFQWTDYSTSKCSEHSIVWIGKKGCDRLPIVHTWSNYEQQNLLATKIVQYTLTVCRCIHNSVLKKRP